MTQMTFTSLPRMLPEIAVWGAVDGVYSFVVSRDGIHNSITASAKLLTGPRKLTKRIDLGSFRSIGAAMAACERFSKGDR